MPDVPAKTSDPVIIRRRRDEDLDECIAVLRRVHARDGYPVEGVDNARGFLTQKGLERTWVAELESKIVGHIGQAKAMPEDTAIRVWREKYGDKPAAVLRILFVDPSGRGHGVAEKLILAVQEWAEHEGVPLVLNNLIKDQAAKRLYERLGWTQYGETIHRYGDNKEIAASLYVSPAKREG